MTARIRSTPKLAAGLGFVLVSFSLNSIMTRYVVARGLLDPGLTTAVRFFAGAASLVVMMILAGRLNDARPSRSNVVPAIWLGTYAVLISYGYSHIGAAAGTFVFYACVLGTMALGGTILDRNKPTPRSFSGGVVALAGLALLTVGRVEGTSLLGAVLLAGTGLSWGAYSLAGRRQADPLRFSAANFLALGIGITPPALLLAGGLFGTPAMTLQGLVIAGFMGAVTTALSYVVWYWSLAQLSPTQAGTYQLAIPVLTGCLGVVLLKEPFTFKLLVAGGLVVVGMALASAPRRRGHFGLQDSADDH